MESDDSKGDPRSTLAGIRSNRFITGMSGIGKSSVIYELEKLGCADYDMDLPAFSIVQTDQEGFADWVLEEAAMRALIADYPDGGLIVASSKRNQAQFYLFSGDHLIDGPNEVMLERIPARLDDPFGKAALERGQIIWSLCGLTRLN